MITLVYSKIVTVRNNLLHSVVLDEHNSLAQTKIETWLNNFYIDSNKLVPLMQSNTMVLFGICQESSKRSKDLLAFILDSIYTYIL